ncbi:PfkB family carbohydrate kinase [Salinicoccus sp. Marseille-QA3877]
MKFITFGEILMRLSTGTTRAFKNTDEFNLDIGGSEMNVALSLAASGVKTGMITTIPDNPFGNRILSLLKNNEVDISSIRLDGPRIGTYFLEQGFNIRSSSVVYDRKYSSFEQSTLEDYDFKKAFKGYDWFHFSGITPALNTKMQKVLLKAVETASEMGLKVSSDLNFRGNLWSFDEARKTMPQYIKYCDVIFGYEPLELIENGEDLKDGLERNPDTDTLKPILQKIHEVYDVSHIAFTQRTVLHTNKHIIKGVYSTPEVLTETEAYEVEILDRIGTGDAFTAGVIHGLINQLDNEETLNNALGNMLYKHTISGDSIMEDISAMSSVLDSTQEVKR